MIPRTRAFLIRAAIIPLAALAGLGWALAEGGPGTTRVATFIVLFVLAADAASFLRGRLQNALIVVATLLLGISTLELTAQAMLPHVVLNHPPALWTDRPELGWGPKAGGVFPVEKLVDGKSIYKVTYTIDGDLLRHVNAPADGPTIAFLGDSFTFGEGLNDPDTIAQAFADAAPGFRVVNLGFSAYSPAQALRELELGLFDRELGTPRAFIMQTGPWHSERTSCKPSFSVRAPRYDTVDGKLRFEGPCATGFARRVEEFYKETAAYQMFLAPLLQRPSHHDIDNYIAIVGAVAKIAREKYHAPLIVLYNPSDPPNYLDGTGFTDKAIVARMEAAGVHVVDAKLIPKPGEVLRIPGDGHPNATANRLEARKLVDDLRATMPDILRQPATAAAAETR